MKTCLQKLTTLFPYCLALLAVPVVGGELREWEDPKLTGQNNEAPHAIMVALSVQRLGGGMYSWLAGSGSERVP